MATRVTAPELLVGRLHGPTVHVPPELVARWRRPGVSLLVALYFAGALAPLGLEPERQEEAAA